MNFLDRQLKSVLIKNLEKFPAVALLGPRQSGKTTLLQHILPDYTYLNLEDLEIRNFAAQDPKGFLNNYSQNLIIDEAQRVPELFSYLQIEIDRPENKRKFVLSGSENFLLQQGIPNLLLAELLFSHFYLIR